MHKRLSSVCLHHACECLIGQTSPLAKPRVCRGVNHTRKYGFLGATDGTVYHRRLQWVSEPTDSLSQVIGSDYVPAHPSRITHPPSRMPNPEGGTGERTPGQKGRSKNLFLAYQKFTLCITPYVASIPGGTKPKQGPRLKKNPFPSTSLLQLHSLKGINSCLTGIETRLVNMNQSPAVCDLVCNTQL